jgi:hypothetical protein
MNTLYLGYTQQIIQTRANNHRNAFTGMHSHFEDHHPDEHQKANIEIFVLEHEEQKNRGEAIEQKYRQWILDEANAKNIKLNLLNKNMC